MAPLIALDWAYNLVVFGLLLLLLGYLLAPEQITNLIGGH